MITLDTIALDRWITREDPSLKTRCAHCGADCTDCEWALTPEGAEHLGLLEDDLVCGDCDLAVRDDLALIAAGVAL